MNWEPEHRTCEKCKRTILTDPLNVGEGVDAVELQAWHLHDPAVMRTVICAACCRALMESVATWLGRDAGSYNTKEEVSA